MKNGTPKVIHDRVAAQPPRPLSGAKSQRSGLATPLFRSVFFQVRRRAAPRAQGPRVKGVIPKPFRVENHPEWKAVLNGRPFRKENYFEWNPIASVGCARS